VRPGIRQIVGVIRKKNLRKKDQAPIKGKTKGDREKDDGFRKGRRGRKGKSVAF